MTFRDRALNVIRHAHESERIAYMKTDFGFHITIDGRDVASADGTDFACCTSNLEKAEELLGLAPE